MKKAWDYWEEATKIPEDSDANKERKKERITKGNQKMKLFWSAHERSCKFSDTFKHLIQHSLHPTPKLRYDIDQCRQHTFLYGNILNQNNLKKTMGKIYAKITQQRLETTTKRLQELKKRSMITGEWVETNKIDQKENIDNMDEKQHLRNESIQQIKNRHYDIRENAYDKTTEITNIIEQHNEQKILIYPFHDILKQIHNKEIAKQTHTNLYKTTEIYKNIINNNSNNSITNIHTNIIKLNVDLDNLSEIKKINFKIASEMYKNIINNNIDKFVQQLFHYVLVSIDAVNKMRIDNNTSNYDEIINKIDLNIIFNEWYDKDSYRTLLMTAIEQDNEFVVNLLLQHKV